MNERTAVNSRLLVWALASFHTSVLVFVSIFFLFVTDNLSFSDNAKSRGTTIGLAAFTGLWFASFIGASRALPAWIPRRMTSNDIADLMAAGAKGGAITGFAFLALLALAALPLVVYASIDEGQPAQALGAPVFLAVFAVLGGLVAAVIGGAVGIAAGLLDSILLGLAQVIAGPASAADAETPAT